MDSGNMYNDYGSSNSKLFPLTEFDRKRTGLRKLSANSMTQRNRYSTSSNEYTKLDNHHYPFKTKRSLAIEFKRLLLLVVVVVICSIVLWQIYSALNADTNFLGYVESPSLLGKYNKYAVSTDAKHCAKVGKNLLAKGGHAVDAAIGTLICMGVVLPNSLGLGGGCLFTIYDSNSSSAMAIDGREVAPAFATPDMFEADPAKASRGPLSIGVPGEVSAYHAAHQRFGKLSWSELFEDSIKMAEEGTPVVEHLASALRDPNHVSYVSPELKEILTNPETGDFYQEGDIFKQPKLAETLRRIRDNGAAEFYNGTTAKLFIDDLQKQGGKITMEDMSNYKALLKPALYYELGDKLKFYSQPLPGSGVVLRIILGIMTQLGYYHDSGPRESFEEASLYYHHLVEAMKFGYAQRGALEDQPDDPKRLSDLLKKLESNEFIKDAVSKITNATHPSEYYGGDYYIKNNQGTAHVSVLDSNGNAVAATSSVNLYFGSGLVSPSTGIIYNDVMDDFVSSNKENKFRLSPSKYNHIKAGRKPLSSMAPSVFIDDGRPVLVIGASGGAKITSAIASVASRHLLIGDNIKEAIDGPRLHHQYLPDQITYELNFPQDILEDLEARGHLIKPLSGRSSIVMAVASHSINGSKIITANSDYRKGGLVDGE